MSGAGGTWLDRLALRSVGGPRISAGMTKQDSGFSDERFTRAAAMRLALAGAASLSLGLWEVPQAQAKGPGQCFIDCNVGHDRELAKQIEACTKTFGVEDIVKKPAWKGVLLTLFMPGKVTFAQLADICILGSTAVYEASRNNCIAGCRKTCRTTQSRSLQGRARSTCEVKPPPKAKAPEVPPAPSPDDDLCLICQGQEGGYCCPCGGPLGWTCIEEGACKAGISCG